MSFMSTRQGQTLWMLPLSQTRGTEEGFMGEGGRVVPPLGTAEALHTGPWSGLAADRTQTWQRLPRAQATAPEPPAAPPSGRGKDGGQPRHRIRAPTPPPEGPGPCSLQPAAPSSSSQSENKSHPPGSSRTLFLRAVWAKSQEGEWPVCAAPAGLAILPTARLRGPVPRTAHLLPIMCHPHSPGGLWGSTELTEGSSLLPRDPQQGQKRGQRMERL